MTAELIGTGTPDDPWVLHTAPGTSEYRMWRDESADPKELVCQVGSTRLRYQLRAIDDLHDWLRSAGDWVPLGATDEQKPAADGTVEAWGRSQDNPVERLVRPAQGLPRPVRHVPAAAARGAGHRRTRAQPAQQPGPRAALSARRVTAPNAHAHAASIGPPVPARRCRTRHVRHSSNTQRALDSYRRTGGLV